MMPPKHANSIKPNIWVLLTRIGRKKYKATLDLTSGYHQAPVAPTSVQYTTFKIIVGIFTMGAIVNYSFTILSSLAIHQTNSLIT